MKRVLLVALLLAACLTAAYGLFETRRDRNYRRLVDQGEAALAAGDSYAAIEAFSGAVALKSDSMLGYLRRGEAYQRRHELEAALRDLLRASDLDPTAPRPLELLGDVNASLMRYDRARDRYEAYLAIDDRSPRVLYKLALAHYRIGQPAEGIVPLRKALTLDPRFAEAQYLLGICLRDMRLHAEALAALTRAVALAPAFLLPREALAELDARLGRPDDRLVQLEALVALDPGPARSVALALAYERMGLTERATFTLRQASDRYPDDVHVPLALGRVWLDAAQAHDDRSALARAIEALEPRAGTDGGSEALTLFGRALLLADDDERAERVLQEATIREPADLSAFMHLADAAQRRGHPAVARQALLDHRLLAGDERDPRRRAAADERIGDLSLQARDAATAVSWYQRALDAGASDVSLLVRLASAQTDAGDPLAARTTLLRALETDPANAEALALRRRLR